VLRPDEAGKIALLEDLFYWGEPYEKLGYSIDIKKGSEELCIKLS